MFRSNRLAAIEQKVKQFFHDPAIPRGVGVGQGGTFYGGQSQVVELGFLGSQSGLNIAEAIFAGGLGMEKDSQLVPSREFLDVGVTAIGQNGLIELMSGQKEKQLVHHSVRMHGRNPPSVRMVCLVAVILPHLGDFAFLTGHE
jgi:hypothetical protein